MADENKKPNIFQKAIAATDAWLDDQIRKAKGETLNQVDEDESDFFYRKSVAKDVSYYIGSQGYQEKPYRLTYEHLKQMSLKDSIVSAIIQTRQNQIAGYSKLTKSNFEKGWRISLRHEDIELKKIMEELKAKQAITPPEEGQAPETPTPTNVPEGEAPEGGEEQNAFMEASPEEEMGKADPISPETGAAQEATEEDAAEADTDMDNTLSKWELYRKAKDLLEEKTAKRRQELARFIENCGREDERPFESQRWNLDSFLRAIVRDSMTYDQFGVELVPDNANKLHHFVPVDGSTIRYASPELSKYSTYQTNSNYDLLYPEKELEALEAKDALELDPELLAASKYKFVQVIRGKIERAFTVDELKVGMRNPTTDIFNNGYPVAELELLVNLVSSHLNTEFYNQAYFSQGFSAKGILHIKAPLNRRKLETVRQQWQHMIRGSRNSFQTPIFSGMDEVKWIPLTQNHSDIEFQGWLQYLVKMICAIYQIDPQEIGIGMKEEGGSGGGLSGDNTAEKLQQSKDKGLYPLVRFIEDFINKNILAKIDKDYVFEFVGVKDESPKQALERQEKESKFKKTVNEIRAEDGLPPIPGMDEFIAGPECSQWFLQFSDAAKAKEAQAQQAMLQQASIGASAGGGEEPPPEGAAPDHVSEQLENQSAPEEEASPEGEGVEKALRVEYYTLKK